MPLISIILPVYNGEKTIRATIESVLQQTHTDFELIIINDGSQDRTLETVSSFADHRLRVFSYPNAGVTVSRNRGLVQVKGDYVAFIDADDLWTFDKLEAQLTLLQANPQAAVAYSWSDFIGEAGQFLHRGCHAQIAGNVYADLLVVDFLENGSNPLIRRQALIEVGEFDESLPVGEDWDMWLRLAARYEFVLVPRPQILYRVSPDSQTSNVSRLETSCLQVLNRAFSQAPESLQHLKPHSISRLYRYLTFKSLEGTLERSKGLTALKYIWRSLKHDPSVFLQSRVILVVSFKMMIALLLPTQQAQKLVAAAKKIYRRKYRQEVTSSTPTQPKTASSHNFSEKETQKSSKS